LAGVELTGSILSSTSAYWAPCVGLVSVGGIRLNFTNAISCGTTYPTIEATTLNGPVTINPIDGTSAWTYSVDSQSQTYLNIVGDPTYGQLVGNSIILGGLTGIVQANGTNKATVATNVLQASNEVSVTPVASFSGGGGSFNQTNTGHYEQDVNGHTVTAIGSLSIQAASLGTGLLLVNVAPVNSAANSTYQPCTLWLPAGWPVVGSLSLLTAAIIPNPANIEFGLTSQANVGGPVGLSASNVGTTNTLTLGYSCRYITQ
jgi:hypothetical protein